MRSSCGGHAKDKVQTKISLHLMNSATIFYPLPGMCLMPLSAWRLPLSKSLDWTCSSLHGGTNSSEIGSVLPLKNVLGRVEPSRLGVCHWVKLGVYLRACSRVCLRESWELTWEYEVKQAGSVSLSASKSIIQGMHSSALEHICWGKLHSRIGV